MISAIQKLELVDRRFQALLDGEKTDTIRLNEGKIFPGFLLYENSSATQWAVVYVTDVVDVALRRVPEIVGFDDRNPDLDSLLATMKKHYPTITLDTEVMLVQHWTPEQTKQTYPTEVTNILKSLPNH